jgi:hypothetical protein
MNMAYQRGDAANIIVGAAAIFVADINADIPAPEADVSYKETLSTTANAVIWRNVGYTTNGLELAFAPEFGEVQVDQILDVAKMFKSGMTVTLNTSFAEATLENLAFAIAGNDPETGGNLYQKDVAAADGTWGTGSDVLTLTAGELGDCPVEKTLVAVGTGGGECEAGTGNERVYTAYRVLSIESVTASQKRDEASVFDVSFRLLPESNGRYGQIVDRTFVPGEPPAAP